MAKRKRKGSSKGALIAGALVGGGAIAGTLAYLAFANPQPPPGTFNINASAGSGGSISPSGNVNVAQGGSQIFTITPNSGYNVNSVLVDGISQGALSSYTFTNVQANHSIVASFVQQGQTTHTITASAGSGGSISPSGNVSVINGASQSFTILANSGYQISSVVVDGVSQGAIASYTFNNVTIDHSIVASFSQVSNNYTINATAGGGGSISPSGLVTVTAGGSRTFTITANTGFQISQVVVDGNAQGAIASYTFTNVQANHTISATFTSTVPTFTITAGVSGSGGSISPSGFVGVAQGSNKTFTMIPNTNYVVDVVLVDFVNQGAVSSYTFTNVQSDHQISASFRFVGTNIGVTVGQRWSYDVAYSSGTNTILSIVVSDIIGALVGLLVGGSVEPIYLDLSKPIDWFGVENASGYVGPANLNVGDALGLDGFGGTVRVVRQETVSFGNWASRVCNVVEVLSSDGSTIVTYWYDRLTGIMAKMIFPNAMTMTIRGAPVVT